MKIVIVSLLACLACSVHARSWVELSDYTNVSDNTDDAQALREAIADAGNGGVLRIGGTAVISSKVSIVDQDITIIDGRIEKKFPRQPGSTEAGLEFIANTRANTWRLKNMSFRVAQRDNGVALLVKDNQGIPGGSSFEYSGGSISSGIRSWYEHGIFIDGMASAKLLGISMTGQRNAPAGYQTIAHVSLVGKKTGLLQVLGGRYRQANKIFDITTDYDTLAISCGRVQNRHGIFIEPGVVGRRFIIKSGNEQSNNPTNVNATELISVGRARYALQGGGKTYELTGINKPAIHLFSSKLARGLTLDNSDNALFFGNTAGNVSVVNSSRNVVVSGNQNAGGYDWTIGLSIDEGAEVQDAYISAMEVIR